MATHSSILAWEMPWTEELGGLQSMGSQAAHQSSLGEFKCTMCTVAAPQSVHAWKPGARGEKCSVSAPGVSAGGGARLALPGLLCTACSGDQRVQSRESRAASPLTRS